MISCEKHDYIEIACTYRLRVELIFKHGGRLSGIAQDTTLNPDREECLELLNDSGEPVLVVLDQLSRMRALIDNPYLGEIRLD